MSFAETCSSCTSWATWKCITMIRQRDCCLHTEEEEAKRVWVDKLMMIMMTMIEDDAKNDDNDNHSQNTRTKTQMRESNKSQRKNDEGLLLFCPLRNTHMNAICREIHGVLEFYRKRCAQLFADRSTLHKLTERDNETMYVFHRYDNFDETWSSTWRMVIYWIHYYHDDCISSAHFSPLSSKLSLIVFDVAWCIIHIRMYIYLCAHAFTFRNRIR